MTMQKKGKTPLEEMMKSGSQIVLMRDDGSEQPIEEIIEMQVCRCSVPIDSLAILLPVTTPSRM